jgi:ribose 5-phosphate isomerase A
VPLTTQADAAGAACDAEEEEDGCGVGDAGDCVAGVDAMDDATGGAASAAGFSERCDADADVETCAHRTISITAVATISLLDHRLDTGICDKTMATRMTTPTDDPIDSERIAAEKVAAARRAVELVEPGMRVGLGSGSTVDCVIDALRARFPTTPLPFTIVAAASRHAEERLVAAGLAPAGFSRGDALDLYIDGADEVDPHGFMIKGGGGALIREKILAASAQTVVIAVDSRKPVSQLGAFPLPIAVQQFGWQTTTRHIASGTTLPLASGTALLRPSRVTRRMTASTDDASVTAAVAPAYVTDDGQYILDCEYEAIPEPAALDRSLRSIPGVVETGLFIGLADWIVIGRGHDTEVRRIVRAKPISTTSE